VGGGRLHSNVPSAISTQCSQHGAEFGIGGDNAPALVTNIIAAINIADILVFMAFLRSSFVFLTDNDTIERVESVHRF
jgi:hypothetical protein